MSISPGLHRRDELGGAGRRPDGVRRDDRGARLGEQRRDLVGDPLDPGAAGDQAVLLAAFGAQACGGGMTWPQWWQARRCISRCSTIQAVQLGHWKRWPQWRHRVSGAKPRRLRNSRRLLARGEIGLDLGDQARRQPAAARRRVLGQVDRARSPAWSRRRSGWRAGPRGSGRARPCGGSRSPASPRTGSPGCPRTWPRITATSRA